MTTTLASAPAADLLASSQAAATQSQAPVSTLSTPEEALILDAATGVDIRHDPKVTSRERKLVRHAGSALIAGFCIGEKNGGFGPMLSSVLLLVMKKELVLDGKGSVPREKITADNILKVLALKDLKVKGTEALTGYVAGLKTDVSGLTVKARHRNENLAKAWFADSAEATRLETAIKGLVTLGKRITVPGIGDFELDRFLGVAFGRSIGRAEIFKALTAAAPEVPVVAPKIKGRRNVKKA